ncbi:MAG TPA: chloride channel protein [Rhizomicrobium sp.]|nr:chloride channel protein [Rhizomicrobium sp.]
MLENRASEALRNEGLRDFTTDCRMLVLSAMALFVGSAGAGAAWCLVKLIALFTNLAYLQRIDFRTVHLGSLHLTPLSIAIPILGSLVVGAMARFGSEKIRGHGIPEAIEAILIGESRIEPKVALLKPISSALSIGTGGPFGAEGPIIMTGGALGSLFAQLFRLTPAERKTLLVAGAAAGMTAIFGTPLAAVLLAVELLLFEWKPRSFIPVGISVLVATLWRPCLLGPGPLFSMNDLPVMPSWGLGLCAGMGLVAGAQSALTTLCLYGVEDLFRKLPIHWMWWPALGGIVVGVGGYIDPAALGVGYDSIRALLDGHVTLQESGLLLADKAMIWIAALSSGTSGGVLAPLLIMGGALGNIEAHWLPFGTPGFWSLLAMAAILAGTMRAPLTGTLFAAELTGNFHLLPQLFAASVAAFAVTVLLMRRSILTERIARRGHHITREYSTDPFLHTRVADIMARPVDTLPSSMQIAEVLDFFADGGHRHKSYPVVTEAGELSGIVSRADVLRWSRDGWEKNATLADFKTTRKLLLGYSDELVGHLADRMAGDDIGRVPILDRTGGRLVGLVARRDLLRVRARLALEERDRRRLLNLTLSRKS